MNICNINATKQLPLLGFVLVNNKVQVESNQKIITRAQTKNLLVNFCIISFLMALLWFQKKSLLTFRSLIVALVYDQLYRGCTFIHAYPHVHAIEIDAMHC